LELFNRCKASKRERERKREKTEINKIKVMANDDDEKRIEERLKNSKTLVNKQSVVGFPFPSQSLSLLLFINS